MGAAHLAAKLAGSRSPAARAGTVACPKVRNPVTAKGRRLRSPSDSTCAP